MQSDLQNVQSISFNIITIFTILFVSILFLMFMSYLSSTNKISDLNMRLSQMSNEREELLTQISDLNEIRIANNMQKYEIENNFITKQDFNNFVQVFKNELEKTEKTERVYIPKRNEIVNKLPVIQYYPPSNHIKEMYPVPVIPGGEFLKRGVISMRNMDYPYQDLTTTYQRVGTLATIDKTDDYMMTLYRRDIAPERDLYEYKVIDHTNGNNIEIFLNTNVALLRNGDKIMIPGYESKGEFIVNLDRQYSYIRLRPFP